MAKYLLDMRVGDEYTLEINYGAGIDITGYKFWLTLKTNKTDADTQAVLQHTTIAGNELGDDPQNGKAYLIVPSNVMRTVPAGEYFYDVQSKRPSANGLGIVTLLQPITDMDDQIIVHQDITQADI